MLRFFMVHCVHILYTNTIMDPPQTNRKHVLFIYIIKSYAKYTVNDKKRKKIKIKIRKRPACSLH